MSVYYFGLGAIARYGILLSLYCFCAYSVAILPGYDSPLYFLCIVSGPESGGVVELGISQRVANQGQAQKDLFGGEALKIREFEYSVGPDGIDDLGLISYDPTNGVISGGDIIVPGSQRKIAGNQ